MASPYPNIQSIDDDLLIIDGLNIPEIKNYEVKHTKVYKSQSVNMRGDVRQTLLGIQPTITVTLGAIDSDRAKQIADKLKQSDFDVTYYDSHLEATRTASFYVDDLTLSLFQKRYGVYPETQITLNPVSLM